MNKFTLYIKEGLYCLHEHACINYESISKIFYGILQGYNTQSAYLSMISKKLSISKHNYSKM